MRKTITLSTFRRADRLQEQMIRAAMPRTSANDPKPLPAFAAPLLRELVAARAGTRLVRPLTYTMREVANG